MGWLKLSFGKGGTAVAERETAVSEPQVPSGPPIIVLVNDASGRASFKEYVFHDIEAATDWVGYWFPHQNEDGMIAFWAMPEQPESSLAEPLVLIRDDAREGVVYMFSFANLTAADEFIAQEADHGTDPDSIVLHWAVPVKREFDQFGKIFLTPSTPPTSSDFEPLLKVEVDRRVEQQAPAAAEAPTANRAEFEEASNARTGVARPMGGAEETFELTSWVSRGRERASDRLAADMEPTEQLMERDEPAMSVEPVMEEVAAVLEEALGDAPGTAESVAIMWDDMTDEVVELASDDEVVCQPMEGEAPITDSPTFTEPVQVEQVLTDRETPGETFEAEILADESSTLVESVEAGVLPSASETPAERRDDNFGAADETDLPDHHLPEHVVAPPSVNGNGHVHEVSNSLWERAGELAGSVQYDAPETDASPEEITKKIKEVLVNVNVSVNLADPSQSESTANVSIESRALKIKRWEVREEPFEGFNSPPGRF
jgi:hypothetical protein